MKAIFLILSSLLAIAYTRSVEPVRDIDVHVKIEVSCDKILGAERCAELEKAAETLKQKAKVVDALVRKAVEDGLEKSEEIIQRVRADLVEKARDFKCEDVFAGKLCEVIREVAEKWEIKAQEVEEIIKKTVADGVVRAREIYERILEKIKERIHPNNSVLYKDIDVHIKIEVSCEKILGSEKCAELEKAAEILKQKAKVIDALVRKAVEDGLKKTEDIIERVRADLAEKAQDFKCEDIFAEKLCDVLREVAGKMKIKAEEIEEILKKTITEGAVKARDIYEEILEKIKEKMHPESTTLYKDIDVHVKIEISCEKILGPERCAELEKAAETLKQKAKVIDALVRKAVEDGLKQSEEIIRRVRADLAEKAKDFKCEDVLAEKVCDALRTLAGKMKIKVQEVEEILKKTIAEGTVRAKDIYEKILEQIKEKMHPENAVLYKDIDVHVKIEISCEKILGPERCAELERAAETLKQKAKIIDALVRKAVEDGLKESEDIIKRVRADLAEKAKDFKCEDVLAEKLCVVLRDLAEKMKIKAQEVEEILKKTIAEGEVRARDIYEKILEKIKEKMNPENPALYNDIDVHVKIEISCEKILGSERCAELEKAAETLKQKAKVIDALVRKAVEDGLKESEEIIKRVRADLVEKAKDFKCEDVLAEKLCDALRGFAGKMKIKAEEVENILKKAIAEGAVRAKDIYEKILETIKEKLHPSNAVLYKDIDVHVKIEVTCEKILGPERCAELEKAAETLKQKAKDIDILVKKAVADGLKKSEDILKRVRADLAERAKDFKCEDVLAGKLCDVLRDVAEKMKIKAQEIEEIVKKTIAEGEIRARDIYEKILEKIKEKMHPDNAVLYKDIDVHVKIELSCEKILGAERCAELEKAAETLKQKAKVIDALVRKAVEDGLKKSEDIINRVRADLAEKAKDFKCEDVLSVKLCAVLREVAGKLEIKAQEVEEILKKTIAEGAIRAKDIYEKILEKINEKMHPDNAFLYKDIDVHVKIEISCEKILGSERCAELEKTAEILKQKAKDIDALVRKAVKEGLKTSEDIIQRVRADLAEKAKDFKCEDVLAGKLCDTLREVAGKLEIKATEIEEILKETIADGVVRARDIYEKILEKIKEKMHPDNAAI